MSQMKKNSPLKTLKNIKSLCQFDPNKSTKIKLLSSSYKIKMTNNN